MKRHLCWLALLACLGSGPSLADAPAEADQKRRLAEQKLKLVEMLIDAPATRANLARAPGEGTALIEQSRQLTQQARRAIDGTQYEAATRDLDEALRNVFKLNSRPAGDSAQSDEARRQQYRDLAEQLAGYRASLQDLGRDGRNGEAARKLLGRIDRLSDEAGKLQAAGQAAEAGRKMAEAYKLAVSEISQLRAGQEVVMSLKFDSPADEFAYEMKRYQSNQILVDMMIGEGRAEGERRTLVDGFLGTAARLRDEARSAADGKDYKQAVAGMEKANGQLNRALQAMGVPVF